MAEERPEGSDAAPPDPTPEGTRSEEGTQQSDGMSEQEFRTLVASVIDERLPGHLAAQQQQFDQRLTPLEQLRGRLEEVVSSNTKLERIMRDLARGVMTEEGHQAFQAARDADEADTKREREIKAAADKDTETLVAASRNAARDVAWEHVEAQAIRVAQAEGVTDNATFESLRPKQTVPARGDRYGFLAVGAEWEKNIREWADSRDKAAENKPAVPDIRGGGGAATGQQA